MGANGDGGVAAANLLLLDPDPRTRPGEPSRDRGRAMALQQYSLTKKWKGCVETKWKACPGTRQKPAQSAAPTLRSSTTEIKEMKWERMRHPGGAPGDTRYQKNWKTSRLSP